MLTNPPYRTMILAKYDAAGNLVWLRQAGGTSESQGNAIAMDAGGNLYVTGLFRSQASFGGLNVDGDGSLDVFVVKYDPNGNAVWASSAGGPGDENALGISLDATSNIYITGFFYGVANFGNTSLVSAGGSDVFVARLDGSGSFVWAQSAGIAGVNKIGYGVSADSEGNVYASGQFNEGTWSGWRLFVAKYNHDGDLIWVRHTT